MVDETQDKETILEKLKKIQGYLKSDSLGEASNAAAKLTEMLLKHNLSLSDLEDYAAHKKKGESVTSKKKKTRTSSIIAWELSLVGVIAKANLCRVIYSKGEYVWFGKESNIEVAEFIFDTAVRDINKIADNTWTAILLARQGKLKVELNEELKIIHGKTWKNSFYHGAVSAIRTRLENEVEVLETDPNMKAMIVVNNVDVNRAVRDMFPHLRKTNSSFSMNTGFGAGQKFGTNYQFKTGVGAGGSTRTKRIGG